MSVNRLELCHGCLLVMCIINQHLMIMMLRNHQRKEETQSELEDAGKKVAALRKEIQNQARVIEELRDQVIYVVSLFTFQLLSMERS